MNFVFNIEPRNLAPTLLFARGTHTYAQNADPGTPRRGSEVEATERIGPEIWTKTKFGHGHPHSNADISKGNQYHGPGLRVMEPATYAE